MWEQKSFQEMNEKGILYLVPTPIGNLDDMTFRALTILKQADILAAEDTRHTMKLCTHFDIHTALWSYHEHNKKTSGEKLIAEMEQGKTVALVTDAGMPGISDPGADLAAACVAHRIPVVPLPGANAALASLIASGLATDHFFFYGFLPRSKREQTAALEGIRTLTSTLIFYESPFRIKETLGRIADVLGNRRVALARELTKRYETFLRGSVEEVHAALENADTVKGEFCLVVAGAEMRAEKEMAAWWQSLSIAAHVDHYVETDALSVKEAMKRVALDRGQTKRTIYAAYHQLDRE
ncbi:MAG: 16S rRNA (cytidine(1402)-2'-O)-methyltransferase [Sporolactobacillus sp.]